MKIKKTRNFRIFPNKHTKNERVERVKKSQTCDFQCEEKIFHRFHSHSSSTADIK